MARQWNTSNSGTKYSSASAVWVEPKDDKKPYWKVGFMYSNNKYCTVRLYTNGSYTPSTGRHSGKKCCLANINMGTLTNNNGSNYPN